MAAAVQSMPGVPTKAVPKYVQEEETAYECKFEVNATIEDNR